MPVILKKNYGRPIGDIRAEIHNRLALGQGRTFIYVVPTKRKLRDVQREFLKEVPGEAGPAFFLFTLETLAACLFTLVCPPRRIVAGPAQSVLVNEAVHSLRKSLRYFRIPSGNRLPKGTSQKLVDVINKFKELGVYLSVLYSEVEASASDERLKLSDILSVYQAYENRLGDHFIDAAGMLKSVNAAWDTKVKSRMVREHFSEVDTIMVSGFDEFSDPELTMLYNLSELSGVGMLVSFDYHHDNEEIFGHLRENYQKFLGMGFQKVTAPGDGRPTFEDHIRQHLFRRSPALPGRAEKDRPRRLRYDGRDSVTLLYPRDRQQEVETVAKLIKRLVREKPVRDLSKICVATYQPQVYARLFRETFSRFGIPANVTDRYSLDQSPLVVSLLALLDVQDRNFRLKDLMRALSSPYLVIPSGTGRVDAGNLYQIGTRLKMTAGQIAWHNRIEQRLASVREGLSIAADEIEEVQLRREETMLRRAQADINALSVLLKRFSQKMSPRGFRDRLLSLMKDLKLVESILAVPVSVAGEEHIEKDSRAYQKFVAFLDEFLDILALERGGLVHEGLKFYLDRLRTAVAQVRYNVRQKYGYGVVVTSFDETRGLGFEVMIIVGLVDGEFPPAYHPELFFSKARREREERYHLTEHRYLFYQVLTNFTEHLYLTVPRYDGETQVVPSSFVDALTKVVELQDFREKLPDEFSDKIYGEDELLFRIGHQLGVSPDWDAIAALPSPSPVRKELLDCIGHMRRAIEIERSRTGGAGLPEYNGRILNHVGNDARAALIKMRDAVYSVTQLESYGRCPFQFFVDKVLRLNVIPEIEEGISPLERGGMMHEILFEFYVRRRERSLPPLSEGDEAQFQQAIQELREIALRRFGEWDSIADPFWNIDKELILGSENRKGILNEFLEMERDLKLEVEPSFFEVTFGARTGSQKIADPLLKLDAPVTAGRVRLRGKIDRIDIGKKSFRIVDYKTGGRVAKRHDMDLGMSLQLPVYLHAVEEILNSKRLGNPKGAAGIYYWLKLPVEQRLGLGSAEHLKEVFHARKQMQLVGTDEELKQIIDQAIRFVNEYVERIAGGDFPVEPKEPATVCPYCSFGTICRIRTLKPGDAVTPKDEPNES